MVPKTKQALERSYRRCGKSFVKIDKSLYREYQQMAYDDLESAAKEESPRWAATKAYQALFLMCNAVLVKKLGFYSKDHNCIITALLYDKIIPEDSLRKIHDMLKKKDKFFAEISPNESFFEEIANIRISRNNYLYLPKALRNIKTPADRIIDEVRELIRLLGEIE
ncbi:MAG: hypothetical protein QME12_03905 [Nanoarchaeota archaeon]|nr:hypothetical protein [Nanoarchaeota archaeon]